MTLRNRADRNVEPTTSYITDIDPLIPVGPLRPFPIIVDSASTPITFYKAYATSCSIPGTSRPIKSVPMTRAISRPGSVRRSFVRSKPLKRSKPVAHTGPATMCGT
jgi:hypothetical protein